MNKNFIFSVILLFVSFFSLDLGANNHNEIRSETTFNVTATLFHDSRLPTALLVMIDGSVWEIVSPPMVKRTPDSEEPLFSFRLEDWEQPISVAIDHIQWVEQQEREIEDSHYNFIRSHEDIMAEFPYAVENRETGKYTFARPAKKKHIIDFFTQYSTYQYQNGFDDAVNSGFPRVCGTGFVPS